MLKRRPGAAQGRDGGREDGLPAGGAGEDGGPLDYFEDTGAPQDGPSYWDEPTDPEIAALDGEDSFVRLLGVRFKLPADIGEDALRAINDAVTSPGSYSKFRLGMAPGYEVREGGDGINILLSFPCREREIAEAVRESEYFTRLV